MRKIRGRAIILFSEPKPDYERSHAKRVGEGWGVTSGGIGRRESGAGVGGRGGGEEEVSSRLSSRLGLTRDVIHPSENRPYDVIQPYPAAGTRRSLKYS